MISRRIRMLLTDAAALVVFTGCAARTTEVAPAASAAAPLPAVAPRDVRVFAGVSGAPVAWSDLVDAACRADAVLIGENHGHPVGLASAAALWEDVLARSPGAALCMEFFERDEQSRIDDYLTGVVDEPRFRTRTGRTDGNYPPGHRAMIDLARAARRPVVAANAPRPIVSLVRKEGFERLAALTSEQQRMFRAPDSMPGGRYRKDFDELMSSGGASHGGEAPEDAEARARLDAMFRSQSLWDWTMADSVASALGAGNRPVFLVVGRFHVDHDGGLVQALDRLRPGVKRLALSVVDAWSEELREEDHERAAFVIYVGPGPE